MLRDPVPCSLPVSSPLISSLTVSRDFMADQVLTRRDPAGIVAPAD
jgi:hypothetical protein